MFHDRRQRHRKRLRQLADREVRLLAQPRQQGAPGRIGERSERAVERGVLILNHTVNYMIDRRRCQAGRAGHATCVRESALAAPMHVVNASKYLCGKSR